MSPVTFLLQTYAGALNVSQSGATLLNLITEKLVSDFPGQTRPLICQMTGL